MKVDIFMPFYFGDYIKDTADLTAEEHGAYFLLLGHMWNRGGALPSDPDRLSRLAAVEAKRWPSVWSTIARFFDAADGEITQQRLVAELEKAVGLRAEASRAGKASADARRSKYGSAQPPNGTRTSVRTEPERPFERPSDDRSERETEPPPNSSPSPSGSVSGSESDPVLPDPNPVLADPPNRAREPAAPRLWTPADWKKSFGLAWAQHFCNGARHYGATGDGKACGALGDLIRELPEADLLAAQERAGAMFAEFFADKAKALVDARHCFAFFVGRWGSLRVPKAAGQETDARCDWHRDVRNDARPSRFPRAGCPRCKHFGARAAGRESEPTPIAALMRPEAFDRRAADVERLRLERQQAKGVTP